MNAFKVFILLGFLTTHAEAKWLCISGQPTFAPQRSVAQEGDQREEEMNEEFLRLINEEREKDMQARSKERCSTWETTLVRNPILDKVAMDHCNYIANLYDPSDCLTKDPSSQEYVTCMREALKRANTHIGRPILKMDPRFNNEQYRTAVAKFCSKPNRKTQGCDNVSANVSASSRPYELASVPFIVTGYMNSPGHKQNILNFYINETGVAVCTGPNGGIFTNQIFANTRPDGYQVFTKIPDCVSKPMPIEF